MWLIVIVAIVVALFIHFRILEPYKYWQERAVLEVKPWPIIGNFGPVILCKRAVSEFVEDIYKAYPNRRYYGIFQFFLPTLVIRDPELLKKITVKAFETFPEHRIVMPEDADPLFSKSIFTMRGGEKWREMRATLSPAFTSSKLKTMYGLMQKCANQIVDHFESRHGIQVMDAKDIFSRFTSDVIGTTAFGVTCDSLAKPTNEFFMMGKEATDINVVKTLKLFLHTISPTVMKIFKVGVLSKRVDTFFRALISDTLRFREEHEIIRSDMIHLLMEARKGRLKYEAEGPKLDQTNFAAVEESELGRAKTKPKSGITDEDIAAQAFIFFLAGFDTASTAMSFTAYELAVNPGIQERLREEVDGVCEECSSEVGYEALLGMKYMDMVVSESLRKWPPLSFTDRRSISPFTIESELPEEKPLHLEKGTVCWIPIHGFHRDPQYYPEPELFDPERFSDENKHRIKPFTYMPFGLGPRNCIASRFALLEIKLILFSILSRFEIVAVDETPVPLVLEVGTVFPRPKGRFWLGLKHRKKFD